MFSFLPGFLPIPLSIFSSVLFSETLLVFRLIFIFSAHFFQVEDMDVVEVQCIIANLIYMVSILCNTHTLPIPPISPNKLNVSNQWYYALHTHTKFCPYKGMEMQATKLCSFCMTLLHCKLAAEQIFICINTL